MMIQKYLSAKNSIFLGLILMIGAIFVMDDSPHNLGDFQDVTRMDIIVDNGN
ncbi:hypothetical protein OAO18_00755 [Francisellaceae bacterium]|nr:hypothetical protein [Francisellaceae bacterium]